MDEVVLRRVVGVLTLALAAFLLSWLLPRPGLDRLRGEGERVVTVDLTRPDATPQEAPGPAEVARATSTPAPESAPPTVAPVAPAPASPPEPAQTAQTAQIPMPPAPPKPVDPKPVEPKPVEPKPSKPTPAAAAATAPSGSGTGEVMVQAGAFSHLDKAEGVRTRAAAQGERCMVSPAETPKGTLYRLRCGPYPDRAQAQAAVKTLTAAGIAAQIVGGGR